MGITDWDTWMKEHHVYIPTLNEIENAKKQESVKVRRLHKDFEAIRDTLDEYRKKVYTPVTTGLYYWRMFMK